MNYHFFVFIVKTSKEKKLRQNVLFKLKTLGNNLSFPFQYHTYLNNWKVIPDFENTCEISIISYLYGEISL